MRTSILEKNAGWEATEGVEVMAQTEPHPGWIENPSLSNLSPSGLAALGRKNMEEFAKAQSDLLSTMQDAHRRWFDRMRSEAKLASEFANKVTNCRSIPDAVAVCQEWTGRRFEMMVDDSKHLLTDSQKVMESGARFLSDGLFHNEHGGVGMESEDTPNRPSSRVKGDALGRATSRVREGAEGT
jgi:hypothetical protein